MFVVYIPPGRSLLRGQLPGWWLVDGEGDLVDGPYPDQEQAQDRYGGLPAHLQVAEPALAL